MAEFTGERVIPGLVEGDLWNEHIARYRFASTLAAGKRVLDAGCGSGYGTYTMARCAAQAVGFDVSGEAIAYAREHYGDDVQFVVGSATEFPASDRSFDLITAFEVIEHLTDWSTMLKEAARVVTDDGLFLVSTPNKSYYAETRRDEGPNPFHVHEFEYEEFQAALNAVFPHVRLLAQNHTTAITLAGDQPAEQTEVAFGEATEAASEGHFYLAVCSRNTIASMSFVYVPKSGNVLREREKHIRLLEAEVTEARAERLTLLNTFWKLEKDFDDRAKWAEQLNSEIRQLIGDRDLLLERLHLCEAEVQNRTDGARRLEAQLEMVLHSRWVGIGRRLGLGPNLPGFTK